MTETDFIYTVYNNFHVILPELNTCKQELKKDRQKIMIGM